MRVLMMVLIFAFVAGCGNPKDIVFGPEPLKQIAEQGDQFKKLPEEERALLVSYLAITEMGKAFGADVKPSIGRTVGEVLVDARVWKGKMKAAEAEEKKREAEVEALKNKVLAERKAVADKISGSVVVAIINKTVLPKDYDAGRYSDMLSLKYAVENTSNKTIRQLKGRVTFKDATGDEIGWLPVDIDEPVKPGETLKTTTGRGWKINQFMNGEIEKIAGREFSSMKATFEPESIAFEGGGVCKLNCVTAF
ncbi:MAG: hypothetical protein GZ085_14295 [Sulfuriferula multivorans]|uniref:Lipoprotein n=1 Tax=Sulfuriferula multivorans TaxID=1559896 RepID=A0A7C9TDY6_9PROT|nr:hypothetical protein [Sulfuriferula multivorans]